MLDDKQTQLNLRVSDQLRSQYPIIMPWRRPCPQKILIVTDGYSGQFLNGSFNNYYFGLSAVIDTLLDQTDYYVSFKLTLAHRQIDSNKPAGPITSPAYQRYGPNFENFRFNAAANDIKTGKVFNINDYDQIWLFGVRDNVDDVQKLSDLELPILTEWMENGGGVFATGDHADLGASLCGRVPRVSKMRKWSVAQNPPSPVGLDRHDTLDNGHDDIYTFDDESDDIPMKISPKYYNNIAWHPFFGKKHPHPVLCGKDGVIDILPDHPHEGEIIAENLVVINQNLVNGNPEFPQIAGNDFRPEVIARAHVKGDHTNQSDTNKGAANAKTFGAIGAYDGYRTDVGRVVVDSTWHHWFDVNLIGRPVAYLNTPPYDQTNPKTQGFLASPQGIVAYNRIQNYFINVGLWLAPKSDRLCMLKGLLWTYVMKTPFVERFKIDMPIIQFGSYAYDALGRIAGQCNVRSWIFDVYPIEVKKSFEEMRIKLPDTCLTCPPEELLEIYALGAMTKNLLELAYKLQDEKEGNEKLEKMITKEIDERTVNGLQEGYNLMVRDLTKSIKLTTEHLSKASKVDCVTSITRRFPRAK
ncbi:MAG: hypothetical protein IT222_03155 [Crocinitomix sp.]|nr:hypothetical protein [Crocinitomix sp.]